MLQKTQQILNLIEQNRKELSCLLEKKPITHPEVIAASRRLDMILNYYDRLIK